MLDSKNFPRIHKLPVLVSNQIAAGEVIERPASVVKELIENSIDASATKIIIDIEDAGKSLIRVRDNGLGIHKDDLVLALQAHATSKLSTFSDLTHIVSMGFRGEAIPSIASVSLFKMISRLRGTKNAWAINNQFQIKPASHEIGTTVEVNELFFSIPGRRKFLKSEKTEYLHIQSLIRAFALSHFSIGFFVKHNGNPLFNLSECNNVIQQRVISICGRTFIDKSVELDTAKESMHLWGWLGLSDVSRSQSDRQYFYLNGRIIRDKHVNHAIRLAYDDRIPTGRYPSYVLYFEIDPSLVDVNVHPAKSEVRFSEIRNVHDFIYSSLLGALRKPKLLIENNIHNNTNEFDDKKSNAYSMPNTKKNDVDLSNRPSLKYLSLLSNKFLIAMFNGDDYLIDIVKAKKLITSQYLYKNFLSRTIVMRPILVPVACELDVDILKFLNKDITRIEKWGFKLEQIAPTQILIRSIPAVLIYSDVILLVKNLLDALYVNKTNTVIAKRIAEHVNDSGTILDDDNMKKLIGEIISFEKMTHEFDLLPWRKLDSKILSLILDEKE